MSQNGQSLLSLSIAAANAAPIPASPVADSTPARPTTKHRRLSSAGRSRRRLSDARDAATRPFPTSLQTASASLAALSLSSPTVSHRPPVRAQPIQVPRAPSRGTDADPASVDSTHLSVSPPSSVHGAKQGRKRGTIYTCESCSKVYRHPSCLIKHRWEHTPQWREASKFVLSKHQQVQLLEAAAILSHLSPSSASLPDDRSLWPSFLSGGLVPPPASVNTDAGTTTATSPPISASGVGTGSNPHMAWPISSSVPARTALGAPRLHDYVLGADTGVTQVRPGVVGVGQRSPAPAQTEPTTCEADALNLLALTAGVSESGRTHAHGHSLSLSYVQPSRERERRRSNAYEYGFVPGGIGTASPSGGWLPRSSVRSKSGSSGSRSQSQSASESRSEDEEEGVFGDRDGDVGVALDGDGEGDGEGDEDGMGMRAWTMADDKGRRAVQAWDGMEMEMEMD